MGWLAGITASQAVEAFDHWITFGLLCGVGVHMTINARRHLDEDEGRKSSKTARTSFFMLVMIAISTSLDAMTAGISLAFLDVNIFIIAAAIGLATFSMSTLGILLGCIIIARLGRIAEAGAGLVLIGLGFNIPLQHLTPQNQETTTYYQDTTNQIHFIIILINVFSAKFTGIFIGI